MDLEAGAGAAGVNKCGAATDTGAEMLYPVIAEMRSTKSTLDSKSRCCYHLGDRASLG